MNKVGIIGLGLIGGSLAKRLKKRNRSLRIAAMDRSENPLCIAKSENIIDEYDTKITDIFSGCDIIFICTPVDKICGYVGELLPYIDDNCIVTDVGSTKGRICEMTERYPVCFIGGHPMAGSEKSGYEASKDYLFENAFYLLTPQHNFPEDKLEVMRSTVQALGAMPIILSPMEHDRAVASVSHMPHVIAAAMIQTVEKLDSNQIMRAIAAGGFKDITRIASSSPEMWRSIVMENAAEIRKALAAFKERLEYFEKKCEDLDADALLGFFQTARDYRDSFTTLTGPGTTHELRVDVEDRPGIIAEVATLLSVNSINIKNIGIINSREYENGVLQIVFDTGDAMRSGSELLEQRNFSIYSSGLYSNPQVF